MGWSALPTLEEAEMKNLILVTLLLSTVIALPAVAQQANSSSSTQAAASADQATPASTEREPLRTTKGDFWEGEEPGAAWLILHPFASKGYVQRQTSPIRERVNELDEITAANGKMIKDIDARSQQGIQLASKKVNEGEQHTVEASNKSQMGQQATSEVNTHLTRVEAVVGSVDQYKAATQTVIRFRPGQSVLSQEAKHALDEMASPLKDQHGYVVEVQGFASGSGQTAIASSRKMADSVVRYLVLNHEIPAYRIYVVAMGNAPVKTGEEGTAAKHASSSRVEVSVLKNNLDQLASTSVSGASTSHK
jgi:outer membrane protein OmpA-like peptidoglycan-associated protein